MGDRGEKRVKVREREGRGGREKGRWKRGGKEVERGGVER